MQPAGLATLNSRPMDPELISEDDFRNVWGAHVSCTGDLFNYAQVHGLPLNMVWTIVDTDEGHWIAIPGFHVVNKLGYCLTQLPWNDNTPDAYWFYDDVSEGMESTEVH